MKRISHKLQKLNSMTTLTGYVDEWCSWSKGPSGGYDVEFLYGTRVLVLLILAFLQLFVIIFLFKQISQHTMNIKLKSCLLTYHITLFGQYCLFLSDYLHPAISSNDSDLNTAHWCYAAHMFNYVLPIIYVTIFVIFWNLRLNKVFNNSIYEVSKYHNYLVYIWGICGVTVAYTIVIVSYIQAITSNRNVEITIID